MIFTNIETWYWLAGVFLFFAAYSLTSIYIVHKKKFTTTPQQLLSLYMALKLAKIFLLLVFLLVYKLAVSIETKRFVIASGILYGVFLIIDTLYLTSVEKKLKKNNETK